VLPVVEAAQVLAAAVVAEAVATDSTFLLKRNTIEFHTHLTKSNISKWWYQRLS
jgi:hypothetical protein